MSRRTHGRHAGAAWLLATAQLLVSCGLTVPVVLCFSPNGHVAIESALAADCCTPHGGGRAWTIVAGAEDACRCVDTPLFEAQSTIRPSRQWAPAPSGAAGPAAAVLASLSRAATPVPVSLRAARQLGPPGVARALRSVVLLV